MSFTYPWVLMLLVVPAALLIWTWRGRAHHIALPFDHGRPGRGRLWRFVLGLAESLPVLLWAIAIIMLAGPQRYGEPKSRRVLSNIQFCVDVSGSMGVPFGEGTRYDGSMKAIDQFLDYRKGDAFGLTFFGSEFLHWCPLTSDPSAIKCALPFMAPEVAPPWFGGTSIGKALLGCRKVLIDRPEGDRLVILVSDGDSFDLFNGQDVEVGKQLKEARIAVFAIIVGGDADPAEVGTICSITGGAKFTVGDPGALKAVFDRIDKMTPVRMEKTLAEAMDHFRPYALIGLSLLGLLSLTQWGLRYTPW
jgi:Ca-activated chloride channel family protein